MGMYTSQVKYWGRVPLMPGFDACGLTSPSPKQRISCPLGSPSQADTTVHCLFVVIGTRKYCAECSPAAMHCMQ